MYGLPQKCGLQDVFIMVVQNPKLAAVQLGYDRTNHVLAICIVQVKTWIDPLLGLDVKAPCVALRVAIHVLIDPLM